MPGQQVYAASNATYQAAHAGDLLIVGTSNASATNNKVYGLDAATGAVRWTFNATGATPVDQVPGSPWVDHDHNEVIVTTKSNGGTQPSVWVLSTIDGGLVRSFSLGTDVTGTAVWGLEWVLYIPAADGKLYAYDPAAGAMKWSSPFNTGAGNAIVGGLWEDGALPGTLFFTTADGDVWAVQSSGGAAPPTQVWRPVSAATEPFVLSTDDVLWMGGTDGKVHQVRLSDGMQTSQVVLGDGTAAVGPVTRDWQTGYVYAGTAAGKVFAIPTPLP